MERQTILSVLFLIVAVVDSPAKSPVVEFALVQEWSVAQSADVPFAFGPEGFYPSELIGAVVDTNGVVFVCDRISEKLIKLGYGGDEVFAVGTVGEGPEDHRGAGEPVVLPTGGIARADFSMSPKVLFYKSDGTFDHSWSFDVDGELVRLFWNGASWVALASRGVFSGGSLKISTWLVALDSNGNTLGDRELLKVDLPGPGSTVSEDVLWTIPRVAVSDDGFTFVQSSLYSTRVECYDRDLRLVWAIENQWPLVRRADNEPADLQISGNSKVVPAVYHQSIRSMFARENGEVWIQPQVKLGGAPGTVEFLAFGKNGEPLRGIRLIGLPETPGRIALHGDKLLWVVDEDVEGEYNQTPFMAVFKLVRE